MAVEKQGEDFIWEEPKLLRVSETFVDWDYQREEKRPWVAKTSREFDRLLVGVLVGSRRPDGRVAVIDGQQRRLVLDLLGISTVWSVVHEGLTVEDEAQMFATLNFARSAVSSWDHYRALRRARDARVLEIDKIVARHDLEVAKAADANGKVGACGALIEIYTGGVDVVTRGSTIDGPEALSRTLETINLAWKGSLDWPQAKTSGILRGVSRFMTAHSNVAPDRAGEIFRLMSPSTIHEKSKQFTSGNGSGKGRGIDVVLSELFDKHEGTRTPSHQTRARRTNG